MHKCNIWFKLCNHTSYGDDDFNNIQIGSNQIKYFDKINLKWHITLHPSNADENEFQYKVLILLILTKIV